MYIGEEFVECQETSTLTAIMPVEVLVSQRIEGRVPGNGVGEYTCWSTGSVSKHLTEMFVNGILVKVRIEV